jgi:hypothetical protein
LCIKLVIGEGYTKMHGQRNIKTTYIGLCIKSKIPFRVNNYSDNDSVKICFVIPDKFEVNKTCSEVIKIYAQINKTTLITLDDCMSEKRKRNIWTIKITNKMHYID